MALSRAERLQLQAAADKLNELYQAENLSKKQYDAGIYYVAQRLEKVLTGHASYR